MSHPAIDADRLPQPAHVEHGRILASLNRVTGDDADSTERSCPALACGAHFAQPTGKIDASVILQRG